MINYTENTEIDDVVILEEIISKKHELGKRLLKSYEGYIKEDYIYYKNHSKNIEEINSDSRITSEVGETLRDTYKSNPKSLQRVKKSIKENLPEIVKAKCPYCMISAHSTFDHYLDKAGFPEYSLFSLNLIPACAECNSLKKDFLLDENKKRMFINFIYDELPAYPFLKYEIGYAEGKPYLIDIHLEFKTMDPINKIIENHFEKLHLYKRLENQFENTVSTVIGEFKEYSFERSTVETMIETRIRSMEKTKGINYWEICILRAILENNEILDDISR